MNPSAVRVLPKVVVQHVEDLVSLWNSRRTLARSNHVALRHLARIDDRIAAHQDGCVVAGTHGLQLLQQQLETPTPAKMFALTVVALDLQDRAAFERILSTAEAVVATAPGLISGLGWTERDHLAGLGKDLLASESPFRRRLGFAACRLHGADPALQLHAGLRDPDPSVRREALRTAGTVGRHELVSAMAAHMDPDPDCDFWAAWAAVLLGDRAAALERVARAALVPGAHRQRAFRLALQAMSAGAAHAVLRQLASDPDQPRWLVQGSGIAGDPVYVPWLINHMANDALARLAGEAFSLITGVDLALLDLERKPPENFEGPNDDPEDPNVDMDPDDGLPWPDAERVQRWWDANRERFQTGTRYFMGAPLTREHCIDVLRNGYQRQRILAAHYLCLLNPGTPLFNTSAPAWRQQRLLASLG